MTDSDGRRPSAPHLPASAIAEFGLDDAGQVMSWSSGAAQIFGRPSESVIGRKAVSMLIAPRYREMFEAVLAEFSGRRMLPGDTRRLEVAAIHQAGNELMIEVSFSSRRPNNSGAGISVTFHDTSDRVEAERLAVLQDAVDAALASDSPPRQVIQQVLEAICSTLGWSAGTMWRSDGAEQSHCAGFWCSATVAGSELEELTREPGVAAREGLIAEVLSTGEPCWLPSLEPAAASQRERAALLAGMRAAGAVPARDGREMVGVLEFFNSVEGTPGIVRQAQIEAIGLRLGRRLRSSTGTSIPIRYKLDTRNSHLEFSCAFMKFMTVHGVFRDFSGWMEVRGDDPRTARGECTIRTGSVDTRSVDRDYHLRSDDFFAVDRFPAMVYRSTQVEPLGDERFRILGDLTIRDVTRPIRLDVRLEDMETDSTGVVRMTLTGGTVINRIDWFLDWERALSAGRWIVGTEVRLDLVFSLVRQTDRALTRNHSAR